MGRGAESFAKILRRKAYFRFFNSTTFKAKSTPIILFDPHHLLFYKKQDAEIYVTAFQKLWVVVWHGTEKWKM